MYVETIKNLFCDEVAETIAALGMHQVIEFGKYTYEIPRNVVGSGLRAVMEWRDRVYHGITGNVSMREKDTGLLCGKMPVWTLHNMLAHETFTIRSAEFDGDTVLIRSASDLAKYLGTSINGIPEQVLKYHDYETRITLSDDGIILQVTAGETGKTLAKELAYPFSDDAYDDACTGLQCWADATYWDAVHAGEV